MASREMMNMAQMAEYCGKSRDTLYKWAARGYPDWPKEAGKDVGNDWQCLRRHFLRWYAWRLQHTATRKVT
jgi:hypothetical protein